MGSVLSVFRGLYRSDPIKEIQQTLEFREYQKQFAELNPPRKLYLESVDGTEQELYIIMEAEFDYGYLYEKIKIPGTSKLGLPSELPDELPTDLLDQKYTLYKQQSDIEDEKDNTNALKFVAASVRWDPVRFMDQEWVDKNFADNSPGYMMFVRLNEIYFVGQAEMLSGMQTPTNDITDPNRCRLRYNKTVPQLIWQDMITQALQTDGISVCKTDRVDKNDYPISREVKNIKTGIVLAFVSKINGKWKYIGISRECFDAINNEYNLISPVENGSETEMALINDRIWDPSSMDTNILADLRHSI